MRLLLSCFLALVLGTGGALAQQTYKTWSNPNTPAVTAAPAPDRLQELLEKLNALVGAAEQARAADPQFLSDLRDLAASYELARPKAVLSETFADGNYTHDPVWTVAAGKYWVEAGWGLRNQAVAETAAAEPQQAKKKDLAIQLLGQILNKRGGGQSGDSQPPHTGNTIHTDVRISNAFSLELEFSSWQANGHFEIGVYQRTQTGAGYRLVYGPGKPLELVRSGKRYRNVIEASQQAVTLEDKQLHLLQWTRDGDGAMTITLDGKQVMAISDRSFRDPFDGLRLADKGGDFIIKRVSVSGTP